jgi:HEAT repeat protein
VRQRIVTDLRARVGELVAGRETLLSRVTEWQCAVRDGDADAVDLAEFIAMLTSDILELEHRSVTAEQREAGLEEQLLRAREQGYVESGAAEQGKATEATKVTTPSEPPEVATTPPINATAPPDNATAPAVIVPVRDDLESRIDALIRLGRSGEATAFDAISPWLIATEPRVRAAAYQALGHLFEYNPARLEPHLRRGVADSDARVRRRVVLTAAAARGLNCQPLLDPLQRDLDPQVRRLVKEVLRRLSPTPGGDDADEPAARVSGAQGS